MKKQIIFEAETLAALLAASLWSDSFYNKHLILFVDKEGTKFSLLKGFSEHNCVDKLSEAFAELESRIHITTWIARLPSKSNIADPPSRGIVDIAELSNATDVSDLAMKHLKKIVTQYLKNGGNG